MKNGYKIKKLNKWQNKLTFGNWTRRSEVVYRNYFFWYDQLPFRFRPVAGGGIIMTKDGEIISYIKKRRKI